VALAAGHDDRDHDVIADGHVGDAVTDGLDDAGALVAQHDRQWHRHIAAQERQVRVADPGRDHADQHLAGTRAAGGVDLLDGEFTGGADDCCLHGEVLSRPGPWRQHADARKISSD
jgi:hypothetical protein